MQEKRTKPGEKAKHDLNEKTTYRFGNRSFIVEPVFKEETQNIGLRPSAPDEIGICGGVVPGGGAYLRRIHDNRARQ